MSRKSFSRCAAAIALVAIVMSAFVAPVAAAPPWPIGSGNSTITVMNMDSSGAANYVVDFYTQGTSGAPVWSITPASTLAFKGSVRYDISAVSGGNLPSGWRGSVVVSADRNLAAINTAGWSGNQYGGYTNNVPDGITQDTYRAIDPTTSLYFPYVTQAITTTAVNKRFSRITVQNTASSATTVFFNFRNTTTGVLDSAFSLPVNGYRSVTVDLGDPASASFPRHFPVNASGAWNGSLVVTSTTGIVGVFEGWWQDTTGVAGQPFGGWSTTYEAATAPGQRLYAVNVFRRNVAPHANPVLGSWVQWSNLFIQNTDPSNSATVVISFTNTGSATPAMVVPITINPGQAYELNTRFGGTGGTPSAANFLSSLGNLFAGTAVIQSNRAIVSVVHSFWGLNFNAGSSSPLVTQVAAGQTYYIPYAPRACGQASCDSTGPWTQWSKIAVMNVGGGNANVTVQYVSPSGANVGSAFNFTNIAPNAVDALNTRFGSDGGAYNATAMNSQLGTSFLGGALVTSNQPVIVSVFLQKPEDIGNYNAFSGNP